MAKNKNNTVNMTRCRQKNYDMIQFAVPKGQREILKKIASGHGMSLNQYMRALIAQGLHDDA